MLRHVADDGRTVSLTDQAHGNLEPWRLAPNPHEFLSKANKLALREDILVSVLRPAEGHRLLQFAQTLATGPGAASCMAAWRQWLYCWPYAYRGSMQ